MKISVVGCGAGGTKLIKLFSEIEGVEIKSVVDKNMQCSGMTVARNLGIKCLSDVDQISHDVDMIIEATGSAKVQALLHDMYPNKRIVESDVAQMMMTIVDKQMETTERLNYQLDKINHTSEELYKQMNEMVHSTEQLNAINSMLINSSNESMKFIKQTDEMIRAVNKITQQIKILGLNANIEAARAGEHGKGFSVVATEVQKMSDSTSDFASQISELLKALSEENEKISSEIERLNAVSSRQYESTSDVRNIVDALKRL